MIPNKKTLTPNNSCQWLLCPSKSIPGKFYYFNGDTGEARWTISDIDKTVKKDTIHKVTDKAHSYPEPLGPPHDESTNTTNSFSSVKNISTPEVANAPKEVNPLPTPTFGQAVFPKYVTDASTPNVIWAFTPLYVPEQPHQQHREVMDRITQTYETEPIFGQTSTPLNPFQPVKRTLNFTPEFQFRTSTPYQHFKEPMFGQTPKYNSFNMSSAQIFGAKQEACQTFVPVRAKRARTQSESDSTPKSVLKKSISVGNLTRLYTKDAESATMSAVDNAKSEKFSELSENDLRLKLVAKKKKVIPDEAFKSADKSKSKTQECLTPKKRVTFDLQKPRDTSSEDSPDTDQVKKVRARRARTQSESDSTPKSVLKKSISVGNLTRLYTKDAESATMTAVDNDNAKPEKFSELSENDLRLKLVAKKKNVIPDEAFKSADKSKSKTQECLTPKKRVTFDLQKPRDTSSEDSPDTDQSNDSLRMEDLSQSVHSEPLWYLAVDTPVLLSHLQYIEQFVKSDPGCRLLIPHTVRCEAEGLSRGDAQRLRASKHVVVQSKPEYEHASSEDSILQCCWDYMQDNGHVILITNNKIMMNKAKSIDLECHTLEELMTMKDYHQPTPERINELRNMRIVVTNNKKNLENLFLQDVREINNFPFSKTNGYRVNVTKTNILSAETKVHNVFAKKDNNCDKLINLTKPKNLNTLNTEMTHVNDKILNLSIAENSAAKNRTKKILKNVFQNTEDNQIEQNKKYIDKEKYKDNLSDTNKVNSKNEDVRTVPNNDEIDLGVRKLNVTVKNPTKIKDTIKVSGITKLDAQFNLDEELQRFDVKNVVMENRIKSRLDEWICRLNQTMEGVLTDVLIKENAKIKKMMPPWSLFEALQVTGEAFRKQQNIKTIVDRFSMKHLNCASNNGKLIKNIKPNDLMQLIGLSMILIQNFKDIFNYKELYEAEDRICELIKNIEDPNTDKDLTCETVNTPIFSRSEILERKQPIAFVKSESEVIDYLKNHFEVWKMYEIETTKKINVDNIETHTENDKEPNVVRTFGKNLNMLKINNTKTITLEHETNKIKSEPKVIRNVKIIDGYEDGLKEREEFDLNKLDYEESLYDITISSDDNIELAKVNDDNDEKRNDFEEYNEIGYTSGSVSSDFDNECVRAYPLVKLFLVNLKKTFIRIYYFINDTMKEYQRGMSKDKKEDVKLKTEMAREYVIKIAERLKSIIARESGNVTTLKDLLIKAGDYVEDDRFISNYKQVISKYLEQAQILLEALTLLLSLSNAPPKAYSGTFQTSSPLPRRVLRSNHMVQVTNEV